MTQSPHKHLFATEVGLTKWLMLFLNLVPAEGFEPPTYGLQNRCTTTVLSRHLCDRTSRSSSQGAFYRALPPCTQEPPLP
jgi:hypothetical protein